MENHTSSSEQLPTQNINSWSEKTIEEASILLEKARNNKKKQTRIEEISLQKMIQLCSTVSDFENALLLADKIKATHKKIEAYSMVAQSQLLQGKEEPAMTTMNKAHEIEKIAEDTECTLALHCEDSIFLYKQGKIHEAEGQLEAMRTLIETLCTNGDESDYYIGDAWKMNLVEAYIQIKNLPKAFEVLDTFAEKTNHERVLLLIAKECAKQEQSDQVKTIMLKLEATMLKNYENQVLKNDVKKEQREQKSEDFYKKDVRSMKMDIARVYLESGKTAEANELISELATNHTSEMTPMEQIHMIPLLTSLGYVLDAKRLLNKIIDTNPKDLYILQTVNDQIFKAKFTEKIEELKNIPNDALLTTAQEYSEEIKKSIASPTTQGVLLTELSSMLYKLSHPQVSHTHVVEKNTSNFHEQINALLHDSKKE